jgi:hypothetical protein
MKNICITATLLLTTFILVRAQSNPEVELHRQIAANQAETTAIETPDHSAKVAMMPPFGTLHSAFGHQRATGIAERAKTSQEGKQPGTDIKRIQSFCEGL